MNKFLRTSVACTAVIALSACNGDDDPTGPEQRGYTGDQPSEQVSQEIAMAVFAQAFSFGADFDRVPNHPGQLPEGLILSVIAAETQSIDESWACDGNNGTASISGTATSNPDGNGNGTVAADLQLRQNNCDTHTSEGIFQVSTDPTIDVDLAGDVSDSRVQIEMGMDGGFEFTSGSSSGTCTIDMAWDLDMDRYGSSGSVSVSGSVCGHRISISETV